MNIYRVPIFINEQLHLHHSHKVGIISDFFDRKSLARSYNTTLMVRSIFIGSYPNCEYLDGNILFLFVYISRNNSEIVATH